MLRKTKIIVSAAVLVSAIGVAVGTTYALFTSTKTVNNHIKAGSLKVGFYMTSFVYDQLDSDGLIESHTEDLTSWTGYNTSVQGVDLKVFTGNVINVDKFCPDMSGYAIFKVVNEGDIAFNYTFEVTNKKATWKDGTDKTSDMDSVFTIDTTGVSTDVVKKGASVDTNKVSFEFDELASNDWMESTFTFDIVLSATQVTKN